MPAVLGVTGVAVIVVGLWMYPRRSEVSAPAFSAVVITGSSPYVNDHIDLIDYSVMQARPGVARVEVDVQLGGPAPVNGGLARLPRGAYVHITLAPGGQDAGLLAQSPLRPP